MLDHSHLLLGDLAGENSNPRPVQAELTREIEELRNRKTSFVEDLINLKSFKEKQFSKVENLREEIMRENHVLFNYFCVRSGNTSLGENHPNLLGSLITPHPRYTNSNTL